MKKFFLILITLGLPLLGSAQTEKKPLISFIYVAHTMNTPVASISTILKNAFNDARNYDQPTIFYLPNLNSPFYAYIDGKSTRADYTAFDMIVAELQEQRFHEIDAATDVKTIMQIFDEHDFIDDDGQYLYDEMYWTFYIDQSFWNLGYNEKVISKLFFNMDMENIPMDFFWLKISYSGSEDLIFDHDLPFGKKNLSPQINKFELLKL